MNPLERDFLDIFRNHFPEHRGAMVRQPQNGLTARFPQVNVWEDEAGFSLEAELPGVTAENLEAVVVGNELSLKGERKPVQVENASALRREVAAKKFARVLQFPCELDSERVEATLKNGVLTMKLPKAPSARTKKITISSQQ
ncbi:MAG: Hsp20/alpha crystallin family protein [Bdellovibrionota bacterium]